MKKKEEFPLKKEAKTLTEQERQCLRMCGKCSLRTDHKIETRPSQSSIQKKVHIRIKCSIASKPGEWIRTKQGDNPEMCVIRVHSSNKAMRSTHKVPAVAVESV